MIYNISSNSDSDPVGDKFIIPDIDSEYEDQNKNNFKIIRMYYIKYNIYVQMNIDSPVRFCRSLCSVE